MLKVMEKITKKEIRVAVAGNPNSGKSTLINSISGSRLTVGNWPGVTVEKKQSSFEFKGNQIKLVDLPGTYSLSPYSQEEIIARDFLLNDSPDIIINVVDATNLERNLYLTIQLLELGIPLIIALNIFDENEKKGYKIDVEKIENFLGVKVIPTIATQKTGINNLLDEVDKISLDLENNRPRQIKFSTDVEEAIQKIKIWLEKSGKSISQDTDWRWKAVKIIEKDYASFIDISDEEYENLNNSIFNHLVEAHDDDLESLMADERYSIASGLAAEVLSKPKIKKRDLTDRIDKIVLNKYLGIPIFFAAMWMVFKLTFDIANPFVDWIDGVTTGPLHRWIGMASISIGLPDWTVSLATDGVVAGVGFVLVFVPVIFAMMFFVTFLEGSGYMARAAFVMDRAMHAIGLHGKSFIPLLLGFGCNVPSIYATRTLENKRDKILTALLVPFMSCGARLPVYVIFISVFFANQAGLILWLLYTLGIGIAIITGFILKKTLFKGETPMFIMELPPYRMPTARNLLIHTWEKGKHFLVKAGTYILAVSVFVWFMLNLPWGVENKKDSLLGMAGQITAPIFEPIGFGNWEASSALLTGIIAKEIVVGTMAEIYVDEIGNLEGETPTFEADLLEIGSGFITAVSEAGINIFSTFGIATISADEEEGAESLKSVIFEKFSPLAAFSFMVFVLLYMPCVITGVAMKQEFGTWRWYWVSLFNGFGAAWIVSFLIYQIGSMIGIGV